jgi:hypothetical protein
MHTTTELLIGAASALGGSVLIGLERERRKGTGSGGAPAGIRSFGLAPLAGFAARAITRELALMPVHIAW